MPTTYTNGLKLPDLGSIDWFASYKNNIDILDPIVGTVNGVATTYAPISHNHSASEITSGTIDIARLPPAALERMHIVADQTARYALTTSAVQEGDTVKQTDTGVMYLVVDSTKLDSADGYTEYSAGTASKAIADEDGTSIKTGYVNVAGNQTVSGQKTWGGNQFYTAGAYHRNNNYEIGNTPVSNVAIPIYFTDKVNVHTGYVRNVILTTGKTQSELLARNKFTNGALSPTGTDVTSTIQVEVQPDGSKTLYFDGSIRNNVLPYATNAYSLGSSSYQWSSVYAQSYYYNGTAWGLDKSNEWTGNNTFTASTIALKNTVLEQGVVPSSGNSNNLTFVDKNGDTLCYLRNRVNTDGETYIHLYAQNKFANGALDPSGTLVVSQFYVGITKNGVPYVVPRADTYPDINNTFNLGTSTNKWKSLNGINPGALSLPNGNAQDISWIGDLTIKDGSGYNLKTFTLNGWITINIPNTAGNLVVINNGCGQIVTNEAKGATGSNCSVFIPVVANVQVSILLVLQTGESVKTAIFVPCLGNV